MPSTEAVTLEVPADPRYVRYARLAAAAMADDLGMDVDVIEDLRVGVNELFGLLITGGGGGDTVTLTLTRDGDAIVVEGSRSSTSTGAGPELDLLAAEILKVVVDEHDFTNAAGTTSFRLVKRVKANA